ncbi:MAG: helix-turn-helix transcriptional regulator [Deltaproteobacteria bacterium]|nr:helix-turn-helix transcriptional regulator [Deltaproteobacteria bacterium]
MDATHQAFTARLRALMAKKGWSANRLGDLSGLTGSAVAAMLRGEKSPTLRSMKKLAEALGVRVTDLLDGQ